MARRSRKRLKTLRQLKAKAWKLFSEWIRRSYADTNGGVRCYTCDIPISSWKQSQCGHAIGGRHNIVLLDPDICRPQCVSCNVFRRGNYPVFTSKLIKEHGVEWFEDKLAGSRLTLKFNRSDFEGLILSYQNKLKALHGPA